jgi:DNA-binding NarL/FixJ family response regulator
MNQSNVIKIIIADDHDLIRLAIRKILELNSSYIIVGESKDCNELLITLNNVSCDFLVLDLNMPGSDGISLLKKIHAYYPEIKIIVLTVEDDKKIVNTALSLGARGYILKENATKEIYEAIDKISNGNTFVSDKLVSMLFNNTKEKLNLLDSLTTREIEILYYLSLGKSNKDIGEVLYISEKTVRNYSTTIFKKLEVSDRVSATLVAIKNNVENYFKNLP